MLASNLPALPGSSGARSTAQSRNLVSQQRSRLVNHERAQSRMYPSTNPISRNSETRNSEKDNETPNTETLLKRVLTELAGLKRSVAEIQRNQAKLMKKFATLQEESTRQHFEVDKSHYSMQLQSEVAKELLGSLTREVGQEKLETILSNVMSVEDKSNAHKVEVALKWCKKRLTSLKVDERRKVLGIKPYKDFPCQSTADLARKIIRVAKAPTDQSFEKLYLKHLALLRKFAKEEVVLARMEGKMYYHFKTWLGEKYAAGEPSPTEWSEILLEDRKTCWSTTTHADSFSQDSSIYAPDSQNSSPTIL